jgi:hypothetical protein
MLADEDVYKYKYYYKTENKNFDHYSIMFKTYTFDISNEEYKVFNLVSKYINPDILA